MEVFKLAFETTVVGLLTISWLAAATFLLFPDFTVDSALQSLPDCLNKNPTALGIGTLTLAYCLGSAVLPVADQLLNDEHWPLNERAIRCRVSLNGENLRFVAETPFFRDKTFQISNIKCDDLVTNFQYVEAAVLSQPSDKTEGLRQLHERIVVLRGLVFSGFVLFWICLFAYFARVNGTSHWIRPACGVLLAAAFTAFAAINGYHDLEKHNIFDIPVLEGLLVVIAIFGVVLTARQAKNQRFHSKRYVLIVLFFTALGYGGWVWSEIIYDLQIISSFSVLQNGPPAS